MIIILICEQNIIHVVGVSLKAPERLYLAFMREACLTELVPAIHA